MQSPQLVHFNKIGKPDWGYISVGQVNDKVPFDIKRIFWTYFTPNDIIRGGHANLEKEMILIAVSGTINVYLETIDGIQNEFILDNPSSGVFIPKRCWHTMKYSHNAVQLVIASTEYSEEDYIRDYNEFKILQRNHLKEI